MKNLIIIGAGGFGREVFGWAKHIQSSTNNWKIKGFLDDSNTALSGYKGYPQIIGTPFQYMPSENDLFCCAIGNTQLKLKICRHLENIGAVFTTLMHPKAVISKNSKIDKGCIIGPNVVITTDVVIERYVILNVSSSVGHDAFIGEGCTINSHSDINGFVKLGKGVFLGSHASILPKTKVGEFATVGAGSVAIKRVKPFSTVFGVPATTISISQHKKSVP
jgi:sugar O-acyltransferase (sialic acid O-acetyltransferase NeuD family)